jgi:gamma-glutamyltranspeptidase
MSHRVSTLAVFAFGATVFSSGAFVRAQTASVSPGVREAAWFPDGKHIVVSQFDHLWTMTPDGKEQKRLTITPPAGLAAALTSERDPVVSPDGKTIVFAGETNGQFDIWSVPVTGGAAIRLVDQSGDERWPSFTSDAMIVYGHRAGGRSWTLTESSAEPPKSDARIHSILTMNAAGETDALARISEWQPRVSPDGEWVAFVSDRESDTGEIDIWIREVSATAGAKRRTVRVTKTAGAESAPAWSPDSKRIAYSAGLGAQAAVWVIRVPSGNAPATVPAGGRGFGGGRGGGAADPADAPVLASKHGGVPAWSPDGETLLIASFAPTDPGYNGDPRRNDDDEPALFANAKDYTLWRVAAPRAVDANAATVSAAVVPLTTQFAATFDRVWTTLKSLYYSKDPASSQWDALRTKYRGAAMSAKDAAAAEDVIDRMVAEQPLIKHGAEGTRAVVTSGNPLASEAGAEILRKGGNIVDAAIAVDFALGVTEPDASSIGGDGMCLLFLRGMTEPVAIDFKDMTPGHATSDNTKIFNANGTRTAVDGPSVTNIPGIVAGMDLLYSKYGSRKVTWADIMAPAIKLADEGFVLDEALPTTIAEGHAQFAKYPESMKVFMPGGHMPKAGDIFTNKDYAETLRTLSKEGAKSFYTGSIAKRIVEDFASNGGIITAEDLAQYHAVERKPVSGTYRGHRVYSAPPPVSNGADMIEKLQILNNYTPKPGASYATDADFLHYLIESWRVKDTGVRIADPDHWPIEYGNHLEPGHALERFKLIGKDKVFVQQGGGRGGSTTTLTPGRSPQAAESVLNQSGLVEPESRIGTGTTSFALADADGNMIVFTQTLSTWGGSYYVSKGLGFLYNDHFRGGRGGTGYGSMLPLMRSSSTSVPTMLFAPVANDGGSYGIPGYAPKMAVGCAGNSWIPASVYDIIANVIDGHMDAQHAIEAPRIMIGSGQDGKARTQIEDRIPRSILADLEARGHSFQKIGRKGEVRQGYASVVIVNPAKGTVEAGAEPRRSHGAVGIDR